MDWNVIKSTTTILRVQNCKRITSYCSPAHLLVRTFAASWPVPLQATSFSSSLFGDLRSSSHFALQLQSHLWWYRVQGVTDCCFLVFYLTPDWPAEPPGKLASKRQPASGISGAYPACASQNCSLSVTASAAFWLSEFYWRGQDFFLSPRSCYNCTFSWLVAAWLRPRFSWGDVGNSCSAVCLTGARYYRCRSCWESLELRGRPVSPHLAPCCGFEQDWLTVGQTHLQWPLLRFCPK